MKIEKFLVGLKTAFFLAHKSVRRSDIGAIIFTILVVSLAFVNIVVVYSLLDGVIERSEMNVIDFQYGHIVVDPVEGQQYISDANALMREIQVFPEVIGIASHYILGAAISFEDKGGNYDVYSMYPEEEITVTKVKDFIVEGSFLSKHDRGYIFIGKEISGGYDAKFEKTSLGGIHAGDKVQVTFTNGVSREYRIKGIFSTDDAITDLQAYVTQEEMEDVLGVTGQASEIIVRLDKLGIENQFADKLRSIGVKEQIDTWEERAGLAISMIESFFIVKTLLGFISLLVAAVTIFIVVYITTVSKRREIGVLKAIGIKGKVIIGSFLFQSMFFTILGAVVGYIILITLISPLFEYRPLHFPLGWVTLTIERTTFIRAVLSLIGAGLVGGLLPSWKIVREKILDLIWG